MSVSLSARCLVSLSTEYLYSVSKCLFCGLRPHLSQESAVSDSDLRLRLRLRLSPTTLPAFMPWTECRLPTWPLWIGQPIDYVNPLMLIHIFNFCVFWLTSLPHSCTILKCFVTELSCLCLDTQSTLMLLLDFSNTKQFLAMLAAQCALLCPVLKFDK